MSEGSFASLASSSLIEQKNSFDPKNEANGSSIEHRLTTI